MLTQDTICSFPVCFHDEPIVHIFIVHIHTPIYKKLERDEHFKGSTRSGNIACTVCPPAFMSVNWSLLSYSMLVNVFSQVPIGDHVSRKRIALDSSAFL